MKKPFNKSWKPTQKCANMTMRRELRSMRKPRSARKPKTTETTRKRWPCSKTVTKSTDRCLLDVIRLARWQGTVWGANCKQAREAWSTKTRCLWVETTIPIRLAETVLLVQVNWATRRKEQHRRPTRASWTQAWTRSTSPRKWTHTSKKWNVQLKTRGWTKDSFCSQPTS